MMHSTSALLVFVLARSPFAAFRAKSCIFASVRYVKYTMDAISLSYDVETFHYSIAFRIFATLNLIKDNTVNKVNNLP